MCNSVVTVKARPESQQEGCWQGAQTPLPTPQTCPGGLQAPLLSTQLLGRSNGERPRRGAGQRWPPGVTAVHDGLRGQEGCPLHVRMRTEGRTAIPRAGRAAEPVSPTRADGGRPKTCRAPCKRKCGPSLRSGGEGPRAQSRPQAACPGELRSPGSLKGRRGTQRPALPSGAHVGQAAAGSQVPDQHTTSCWSRPWGNWARHSSCPRSPEPPINTLRCALGWAWDGYRHAP